MLSEKAEKIEPFIVMEVLERAQELVRQGKHVIHLEVGEPDFDVPPAVAKAAMKAILEGHSHYTHSLGNTDLREELVKKYREEYGVSVTKDQILVTSGSSPAILMILGALCNPDDEVIISDPGYACYPNFIRFLNAKVVRVPVYAQDGFQYMPEEITRYISNRTRAIIINSPMNPTGTLISKERMKQIAEFNIPIISDEIYHGLVYEGRAHSILEVTNKAFVINGFSKLYAMTGYRLGYVIAPREYVRALQKFQQNLFICANSVAQMAGLAALQNAAPQVEMMRDTYNSRRIYMIERLKQLGFSIHSVPAGAFYIFLNARHLSENSHKLAFDILEKVHVGVAPGIDFGPNAEGYIRLSYANSIENIKIGLNRLEHYISQLTKV